MPDKDFSDEVMHYQENLTIGLRHRRLLIKLYLTHKSNVQSVLPHGLDLLSVLWAECPGPKKFHALCSL